MTLSLDDNWVAALDTARGSVPRSRFVEGLWRGDSSHQQRASHVPPEAVPGVSRGADFFAQAEVGEPSLPRGHCPACEGSGYGDDEQACRECGGSGRTK